MDSIRPTEYQMALLRNIGCHLLAPLLVGWVVFNYQKGKLPFRWAADTQYALIATLVTEVAMVAARHFYFMEEAKKEDEPPPAPTTPTSSSVPAPPTVSKSSELDDKELQEGINESIKTLAASWGKRLNQKLIELLGSPLEHQDKLLRNLEKQIQEMKDSLAEEASEPVTKLLEETKELVTEITERLQELEKLRQKVGGVVFFSKEIYNKLQRGLEDCTTLDKEGVQTGLMEAQNQLNELVGQEDMTQSLMSTVSETEKRLEEAKMLLAILSEDMTVELQHRQSCLNVEKAFINKLEEQLGCKLKPKPSDGNCLFSSLEEFSDQYPEKDGALLRKNCVVKALEGLENSPYNEMIRFQVEDAMNVGRFEGYPATFKEKLEKLKSSPEEATQYLSEENETTLVGEYWEAMKTPKSFGGEVEMRIIAELFNVYIVVYQGDEKVPEEKIKPAFATAEICDESGLLKESLGKPVVSLFRYGSQDHFAPFIKT